MHIHDFEDFERRYEAEENMLDDCRHAFEEFLDDEIANWYPPTLLPILFHLRQARGLAFAADGTLAERDARRIAIAVDRVLDIIADYEFTENLEEAE